MKGNAKISHISYCYGLPEAVGGKKGGSFMIEKLKEWIRKRSLWTCPYCGFDEIEDDHIYCMMCGRHLETGKRYNEK